MGIWNVNKLLTSLSNALKPLGFRGFMEGSWGESGNKATVSLAERAFAHTSDDQQMVIRGGGFKRMVAGIVLQ